MSATIISIILLVIALWILFISVVFGIVRGMKKSIFRFVWLLASAVILFFVTPPLSNLLNKSIDLSGLNLNIFGPVYQLSDIGQNLLYKIVESLPSADRSAVLGSSAVTSLFQNLPTFILNILLFVLLFWLVKWILWPIWALISSAIFDKDKNERKKYNKKVKQLRKKGLPVDNEEAPIEHASHKKYAGVGAIFGLLIGFVICSVTFVPIVGINNIYQTVYANVKTTNEEGQEISYIDTVLDKNIRSYINSYEDGFVSKFMKYSGMGFVSDFVFKNLATVQVNDEKIKIEGEVGSVVNLYNRYLKISKALSDSENMSSDDVAVAVGEIKGAFGDLEKSRLIYIVGDDLIPRFLSAEVNKEDFKLEVGGQDLAPMIKDAYNESAKTNPVTIKRLQTQLEALADIVVVLNDKDLVVPIIKGEVKSFEDAVPLLADAYHSEFAQILVDNLFKIDMLKSQYPKLVDSLMKSIFDAVGIEGYINNNSITQNGLKDSLTDMFDNLFKFIKCFAKSDNLDFTYGDIDYTSEALESVGGVIDSIKNGILNSQSYSLLVNFLKDKIVENTSNFVDLTNVANRLDDVESWKDELRSLAPLYDEVINTINSEEKLDLEKILDGTQDISSFGVAIQKVVNSGNSILITNESLRDIFKELLDKVTTDEATFGNIGKYFDIVIENEKTLKDVILDNIYDTTSKTSKIEDWGKEIDYSIKILSKFNNTFANFDLEKIKEEGNTDLEDLGKAIDEALINTKLFITPLTLRAIFDNFYKENKNTLGMGVSGVLDDNFIRGQGSVKVFDKVLENIYNPVTQETSITSWEEEMGYFKKVLTQGFDESNLSAIGKLLDDIQDSKLLSRKIVERVFINYVAKECEKLDDPNLTRRPLELIEKIVLAETYETGKYSIVFETEIASLQGLVSVAQNYNTENEESLTNVGRKFDEAINGGSKILTKPVLNSFLAYYIDDFVDNKLDEQALKDAIKVLTQNEEENYPNLIPITSYETEFGHISSLINLLNDGTQLSDVGRTMNSIKQTTKVLDKTFKGILLYFFDDRIANASSISKYTEAVTLMRANIEKNADSLNFESELSFIDRIEEKFNTGLSISSTERVGEIFDDMANTSQIFTKPVITSLLKVVITDELASRNEIGDALKGSLEKIKDNVENITNYKTEFDNLSSILEKLNNKTSQLSEIGNSVDGVLRTNSKLFTQSIITEIILSYFDDETKKFYEDAENGEAYKKYEGALLELRNIVENGVNSYQTMFNEMKTLEDTIKELSQISTLDGLSSIGSTLDNIAEKKEGHTIVGGSDIAYELFNTLLTELSTKLPASSGKIEQTKTSKDFTKENAGNFGENYYTTFIEELLS